MTLFARECGRVARAPLAWAVLALLLAAGTWGALNAARLHAHQAGDIARTLEEERQWYADIKTRAARYSRPSSESVPYWQDPTGASGFSRYFLRRFAVKPHLPLSALAVGHSDLQPFVVPLRLETLFGGDPVYDYEAPRALATGIFDLSFVLAFVLPLAIGAAVAAIGAYERDQGILALVAAQPIDPRRWWSARLAALATMLVPGVAACVAMALAIAGAPIGSALPDTLAALALVSGQTLFWIAVAGWTLARGQGAIGAASTVAGCWLLLTIAVPLGGSLAARIAAPPPSPILDVDELRRVTDAVQAQADDVVARRLAARFGPAIEAVDVRALDFSTRLLPITEEMEARLAPQEERRRQHGLAASRIAAVVWWLSPQMAFQNALADLAGTGTVRHQAFVRAVRAFQLELRAFMYPHVVRPALSPAPRACEGCPGRLTFTDYDAIPRFRMDDTASTVRVRAAFIAAGWLALLAIGLAVVGIVKGGRWALAE
jgi:ABC-2 type transport system permease protein